METTKRPIRSGAWDVIFRVFKRCFEEYQAGHLLGELEDVYGRVAVMTADDILPVGSVRINTLNELCLPPGLKDLLDFSLTRQSNTESRPALNNKSKVLELDNCRNIGKVCLVNTNNSWSIWLLTREGTWAWLADSFTHYFRMSLVHLGLPGWQAIFANLPLIPWAEQLFLLLAPHLLEKNADNKSNGIAAETLLNHIDPNIFKTSARQHKTTSRQTMN